MGRRKKYNIVDPFIREESFVTETGKTVTKGDIIKIKGIWGTKFRFQHFVTNPKNGISWVDCFELQKGIPCSFRSFYPDRVKTMPKKRGKRVKRDRPS